MEIALENKGEEMIEMHGKCREKARIWHGIWW